MRRLLWFILFWCASMQSQNNISGIVINAQTQAPIPYALIQWDDHTTFADVTGRFDIEVNASANIWFKSIGYTTKNLMAATDFMVVKLQIDENFNEKIRLQNEKGKTIIKNAIAYKHKNDPFQQFDNFQFKSYNKVLVSATTDSLPTSIDTIIKKRFLKPNLKKPDSTNIKFKELLSKQHLFITEKVSLFQAENGRLKETVMGTQMSGLTEPIYEIIGFNLQSFSLYQNRYELFETSYNSPLAPDALKDYRFTLLDEMTIDKRPVYVLLFRHKRKRKKAGLEGLLYIDKETYGIARALTRTRSVLDISGTHDYSFLPEKKIWFPVGNAFKIVKGKNEAPIKILGGTFTFDTDVDDSWRTRKKDVSDYTFVISKSEYFDFDFNQPMTIKNPKIYLEIPESAISQPKKFWQQYRRQPISQKEQNTYSSLDSLSKIKKVDERIFFGRKLVNGYFALGSFDFDSRYLLSFNNFEGFRLGIGGVTNERFSKKYRLNGYLAYGLKDEIFKYQLGGATRLDVFSNTWLGFSYTDDVQEIASTSFLIDKRPFKLIDPRPFNISTFYNFKTYRMYLETKIFSKSESVWQISHTQINPLFNYIFDVNNVQYSQFNITETSVSIQWNPFSDFMQTPIGRSEIDKKFPKFTFQVSKSLNSFGQNDFDFAKLDFRSEYEKKFLNGHKTALLFQAGIAVGDVPLTHLYSISPNNLTNDRLLQRITFAGKNSFETMYFNEFFSSRYAMFQFKHGFKKLGISKKINPTTVFVTRMAIGAMDNKDQHLGINFKTLQDGFMESGFEFNQIYKGFGLTTFYRYGPNQLPRFEDNLSLKISFQLDLGI